MRYKYFLPGLFVWTWCWLALSLGAGPDLVWAQPAAAPDPVGEAARLQDAGDFAGAARVLALHVAAHPEDIAAVRTRAQLLYWAGDPDGSAAAYEGALRHHRDDVPLRLAYARMLVELNRAKRARELLRPLRRQPAAAAEAEALLGTLAYWSGDLTSALVHFREALRRNPEQAQARQGFDEIRALTAPWVKASSQLQRDNQPLERLLFSTEAGAHLTPLRSLVLEVQPQHLTAAADAQTASALQAALQQRWPRLRMELEAAAGLLQHPAADRSDWTGRLGLSLRLSEHLRLQGAATRAPYLFTTASLATPIMTRSLQGMLDLNGPSGWLGQAAYMHEAYPDANTIRTAYAWALAPLVHTPPFAFSLGYSYAYQDTEESRYLPDSGTYAPYYTPVDVRVHSGLAMLVLQPARALRLQVNGACGFYATEQAPYAGGTSAPTGGAGWRPGPPQRSTTPLAPVSNVRLFRPWEVRGTLTASLSHGLALSLQAEHKRTAYYEITGAGLSLTYRFRQAPLHQR